MTRFYHIIFAVCAWWRSRQMRKYMPDMARNIEAEKQAIRAHRPVKAIRKQRQEMMTQALRKGT